MEKQSACADSPGARRVVLHNFNENFFRGRAERNKRQREDRRVLEFRDIPADNNAAFNSRAGYLRRVVFVKLLERLVFFVSVYRKQGTLVGAIFNDKTRERSAGVENERQSFSWDGKRGFGRDGDLYRGQSARNDSVYVPTKIYR